jgi:DNA repair exonuclease SbcCD ATPase subunit
MRGQEIDALTKALAIMVDEVKGKSDAANERALLQQPGQWKKLAVRKSTDPDVEESLSFLQQSSSATAKNLAKTFLQRSQIGVTDAASLTDAARRDKVLVLLKTEGQRLSSTSLSMLAMKVSADPFLKIKKIIQQLIERLLSEAAAEATKKGFCDNELSKARKDRDFRFAEVKKLSSDIRSLHAKKDELETELEQLAEALKDLEANLAEATKIRGEEKEENLQTMKDARQGLTALTQAIQILKIFYKQSAKAKVFIQASPLEEDDPGAAKGAYKGNQGASKAILGLLEVLQSDFQRTLSTTEAAEKKAQAEFVEFERTSKADIGAKQTKTELDTEDLSTTEINLEKSMKSLQENQDAVDQATQELEELKPMCIDSGMSYEERVEKREEEIAALKKAVCMMDPDGVEPDCPV